MNPQRSDSSRIQMRKGAASVPAPLDAVAPEAAPGDYAAFLRVTLPRRPRCVRRRIQSTTAYDQAQHAARGLIDHHRFDLPVAYGVGQ